MHPGAQTGLSCVAPDDLADRVACVPPGGSVLGETVLGASDDFDGADADADPRVHVASGSARRTTSPVSRASATVAWVDWNSSPIVGAGAWIDGAISCGDGQGVDHGLLGAGARRRAARGHEVADQGDALGEGRDFISTK